MWIGQCQTLRRRHCVPCNALFNGGDCDTRISLSDFGNDVLVVIDFKSLSGIDKEALVGIRLAYDLIEGSVDRRDSRSSWVDCGNRRIEIRDLPGPNYSACPGRTARTHRGNLAEVLIISMGSKHALALTYQRPISATQQLSRRRLYRLDLLDHHC